MESIKLKDEEKVTCIVCKSQGYLRQIEKACFLVPNDIGGLSSYDYQAKKGQPKNGFTTNRVTAKYLVTGTIFWVAVMVVANYITSAMNRFVPGHGSFCIKGFKRCYVEENYGWCASQLYNCFYEYFGNTTFEFSDPPIMINETKPLPVILENFSEREQEANKNQCLYLSSIEVKMCETLCDSDIAKIYDCYGICMALGASVKQEYCPYQENCPTGCPCRDFECKKGLVKSEPMFAVESEFYFDEELGYWNSRKFFSFILASLKNATTLSTQVIDLNLTEPGDINFCSETYKSQHYVFNSWVEYNFDDPSKPILRYHLEIFQIDEKKGLVKHKIEKDFKDRFDFRNKGSSVCGSGFFAQTETGREDRIFMCGPATDQAACYIFKPEDFSIMKLRELKPYPYFTTGYGGSSFFAYRKKGYFTILSCDIDNQRCKTDSFMGHREGWKSEFFSTKDSGKYNFDQALVVKAFEDDYGTNLIVRSNAHDHRFSFFRLYQGHWIELVSERYVNCYENNEILVSYSSVPRLDPIIISGKMFILAPYTDFWTYQTTFFLAEIDLNDLSSQETNGTCHELDVSKRGIDSQLFVYV